MNRREAIMGLAAASIAAPALALPELADRHAWNAAMARLDKIKGECDVLCQEAERVGDAYARLTAKVPHVTVEGARQLSTANEWAVKYARLEAKTVRHVEPCAYEDHKQNMGLVEAADARDARIRRIDERLGWTEINDRLDARVKMFCDAEQALLDMPAPDGAALLWKIDRLYRPGEGVWSDGIEDQTHRDLKRFLAGTAQ